MGFLEKVFRIDARALRKIQKKAKPVLALEDQYRKMTDRQLKDMTPELKRRIAAGATVDDILPEAFATAREAAKRTIGQFPYPVQVLGATVLNEGDVAEMKTGEGKTLTATMAVYLNALEGKGVHVVTVNQYLASRDADWMGQIYRFLGLSVGVNSHDWNIAQKQEAYSSDITYTTNSELGFDYLRDNMASTITNRVLRRDGLHFAIIDEADSILIDESRTPLIISGGSGVTVSSYTAADRAVKSLKEDVDYTIDIKKKICSLTDAGINKIQSDFGIANLYDPRYSDLAHRIQQALKANYIMRRDTEYMVSEGEILLIDSFTGRVMKGREYSDGLQQALQAKEHVEIKPETVTMATITYQNFFRLYDKLAGMTGTAKTEEEEFRKIYNMRVVPIPTNRPVIRFDDIDSVFGSEEAKYEAIIADAVDRHNHGQPILIGTPSVEKSEIVDRLLNREHIPHEVLNAKNHAREASIIAQAGQMGAVTVATNMAGRGTDIKLGRGVTSISRDEEEQKRRHYNGLAVLGTERNESRRIDNQLRGRSGRQGDPGYSKFYASIKDPLLKRFSTDTMSKMFDTMGDDALDSKFMTKAITSAQKKVEGQNFDTRKSLLDYDDILRQQREIMYAKRDKVLYSDSISDTIPDYFRTAAKSFIQKSLHVVDQETVVDASTLTTLIEARDLPKGKFNSSAFEGLPEEEATDYLTTLLISLYAQHKQGWSTKMQDYAEKMVVLSCIDKSWTRHIDTMSKLRDSIWLRSYANTDPLQAYTNEGYSKFDEMQVTIADDIVYRLLNVKFKTQAGQRASAEDTREREEEAQTMRSRTEQAAKATQLRLSSGLKNARSMTHTPAPGEESNEPTPATVKATSQEQVTQAAQAYRPSARDVEIEVISLLNKGYRSSDVIKSLIGMIEYGYLGKQELSLLTMKTSAAFTDTDISVLKSEIAKDTTPQSSTRTFAGRKEFDTLMVNALEDLKRKSKRED